MTAISATLQASVDASVEKQKLQELELRFLRQLYESTRKFLRHHGINLDLTARAFIQMELNAELIKLLDSGTMDSKELVEQAQRLKELGNS